MRVILSKLNYMFERSYLKLVKVRIEEPRRFIQVIMGPRQVGKTTMIIQLLSLQINPVKNATSQFISI